MTGVVVMFFGLVLVVVALGCGWHNVRRTGGPHPAFTIAAVAYGSIGLWVVTAALATAAFRP